MYTITQQVQNKEGRTQMTTFCTPRPRATSPARVDPAQPPALRAPARSARPRQGDPWGGEALSLLSGSDMNCVEELRVQLREVTAKLVEKTNELDSAKDRSTLMEEHIESLTGKEDIVKANVIAIVYLALFVCAVLCAAGAAAWYYEPIGLPVATSMASRWVAACGYDQMCPSQCEHAARLGKQECPHRFFGSLFS
mmetsp:Transcript_10173/g.25008  ORF Transcript_10173/g.25008 Transcript_10173/m.25008 type:complete len:196 (+) Transcript_10173:400-987(+)